MDYTILCKWVAHEEDDTVISQMRAHFCTLSAHSTVLLEYPTKVVKFSLKRYYAPIVAAYLLQAS